MASGRLIIPLAEPVLDQSGDINPGAILTVYLTGTTTLAPLFGDAGLTQAMLNPQTADQAGRFYAQATTIFADASQVYDVKLLLTDGETFTYDQIGLLAASQGSSGFMPISGGTFTGPVSGITPAANDDSALFATTAFVQTIAQALAPLNSPAFSGTPTAPTPGAGAAGDQIATVAFAEGVAAGLASLGATSFSFTVGAIVVNGGYSAGPYAELEVAVVFETPMSAVTPIIAGGASYIPDAPSGAGDGHTTRIDVVSVSKTGASFYTNRQQSNDPNITGFYWWVAGPK